MGFFDLFKNNNNNKINENMNHVQEKMPFEVSYTQLQDGGIQIEFEENDSRISLGQDYDITRLIIYDKNVLLANHLLSECYVSWYGRDDVQFVDPKLDQQTRKNQFKQVLAEIDLEQIKSNPEYLKMLIRGLMKESRVEEYLDKGLQDNPDRPCGIYIGGVKETNNGYGKFFDQDVGYAAHNTPEMLRKRENYKTKIEAEKRARIERINKEISKLQEERDSL